jgi:GTP cyclohydrolase I
MQSENGNFNQMTKERVALSVLEGQAWEQALEELLTGDMFVDEPDLLVQMSVRDILEAVGEEPDREGLQGTPDRVARMYHELLGGYKLDPMAVINGALFEVEYDEMVVVKDIEFYSLCEHHMLPFFGHAHVAYLPGERVVGLSKIPRIVEMFARRLQVQERMTRQIAELIDDVLQPHGVAVVVEGVHMCSMMRGVKKADSSMVTSAMLGSFRENHLTRAEFMQHLGRGSGGGFGL